MLAVLEVGAMSPILEGTRVLEAAVDVLKNFVGRIVLERALVRADVSEDGSIVEESLNVEVVVLFEESAEVELDGSVAVEADTCVLLATTSVDER